MAVLPIRVDAQRRTAAADEPMRWLLSLRLQQSTGAQERTLREERASQPLPVGQDARSVEAGSAVAFRSPSSPPTASSRRGGGQVESSLVRAKVHLAKFHKFLDRGDRLL